MVLIEEIVENDGESSSTEQRRDHDERQGHGNEEEEGYLSADSDEFADAEEHIAEQTSDQPAASTVKESGTQGGRHLHDSSHDAFPTAAASSAPSQSWGNRETSSSGATAPRYDGNDHSAKGWKPMPRPQEFDLPSEPAAPSISGADNSAKGWKPMPKPKEFETPSKPHKPVFQKAPLVPPVSRAASSAGAGSSQGSSSDAAQPFGQSKPSTWEDPIWKPTTAVPTQQRKSTNAEENDVATGPKEPETPVVEVPQLSEEEKKRRTELAEAAKAEGNAAFGAGQYDEAMEHYTRAVEAGPPDAPQQAVYLSNRAACYLKLQKYAEAAQDSTKAIEVDPSYVKAWMRRSTAYEGVDDLERALSDASKVVELDPTNQLAKKTVARLTPIVEAQREKMKEEMMGKLKDLGNTLLGKFGMSLDNFQLDKDPNTGSYSVKMK